MLFQMLVLGIGVQMLGRPLLSSLLGSSLLSGSFLGGSLLSGSLLGGSLLSGSLLGSTPLNHSFFVYLKGCGSKWNLKLEQNGVVVAIKFKACQ
jgi:hypothetical protein